MSDHDQAPPRSITARSTAGSFYSARSSDEHGVYDLSPVTNMSQSLFSSTRNMFNILKPLDAGSSATKRAALEPWPCGDTKVKAEDLPDLSNACLYTDKLQSARKIEKELIGSDEENDKIQVAEAKKLLTSKPNLSFPCLMAFAVLDSSPKRLTVQEIYQWIIANFPYFGSEEAGKGWKNSGSFWSLKSQSLELLEKNLTSTASQSPTAQKYLAEIKHAKTFVEAFTKAKYKGSPAKYISQGTNVPSTNPRRRHKLDRVRPQRHREVHAIARTLLSLKSSSAKGFCSTPLPAIRSTNGTTTLQHDEPTERSQASNSVISASYDPVGRLSSRSTTKTEELEAVFPHLSADAEHSRTNSSNILKKGASAEGRYPPGLFTFTSPMSMTSHSRTTPRALASSQHRDDLLERMDMASEAELSATAALLSLAGVNSVDLFEQR
eukprot:gene2442-5382_t